MRIRPGCEEVRRGIPKALREGRSMSRMPFCLMSLFALLIDLSAPRKRTAEQSTCLVRNQKTFVACQGDDTSDEIE